MRARARCKVWDDDTGRVGRDIREYISHMGDSNLCMDSSRLHIRLVWLQNSMSYAVFGVKDKIQYALGHAPFQRLWHKWQRPFERYGNVRRQQIFVEKRNKEVLLAHDSVGNVMLVDVGLHAAEPVQVMAPSRNVSVDLPICCCIVNYNATENKCVELL